MEKPTHPGTRRMLNTFRYAHLPPHLQEISKPICELAQQMVATLPEGPELTAGLRKLREAKDCFVIARVEEHAAETDPTGGG